MHRRRFLRGLGTTLAVSALLPLASGCGWRGASSAGAGATPAAPPTADPAWKLALPRVSTQALGPLLAELATRTGSAPVAPSFDTWLAALGAADRQFLAELRDEMASHGFANYDMSRVYDAGQAFFYGVGHTDGLNGCTPVLVTTDHGRLTTGAMVESPLATGLTFLAREWTGPDAISAADALIPRAAVIDKGMEFDSSLPSAPYVYRTRAGSLVFDYHADQDTGVGTLSLTVAGGSGEALMVRAYHVAWS